MTVIVNDPTIGALTAQQTLALTAWAEARSRFEHGRGWVSNPLDAMHDVMEVVDNRVKDGRQRWRGMDHKAICLEPHAFSCWSPLGGAENFSALILRAHRLLDGIDPSDKLSDCLALAEATLTGVAVPILDGATHYHATWLVPPAWAYPPAVLVTERYGHRFYRNVR